MNIPLFISGSDSSCGAGFQCDLMTARSYGLQAGCVVTAVTAQGTSGVDSVELISPATIERQLHEEIGGFAIAVVKSGMIGGPESIRTVAKFLSRHLADKPYVLDPVSKATSGTTLLPADAARFMQEQLFPLATVVTPNVAEAEELSGLELRTPDDAEQAGQVILKLGCQNVLITGGHWSDGAGTDVLVTRDNPTQPQFIKAENFVKDRNVRGTGCAYASAIACGLIHGLSVVDSIRKAKRYIENAVAHAIELAPNYWVLNHQAMQSSNSS